MYSIPVYEQIKLRFISTKQYLLKIRENMLKLPAGKWKHQTCALLGCRGVQRRNAVEKFVVDNCPYLLTYVNSQKVRNYLQKLRIIVMASFHESVKHDNVDGR